MCNLANTIHVHNIQLGYSKYVQCEAVSNSTVLVHTVYITSHLFLLPPVHNSVTLTSSVCLLIVILPYLILSTLSDHLQVVTYN